MDDYNKGKLFLVATPIGNMGDITLRAIETLRGVDVIACEDTRHSGMLLTKFEIKKPLISFYKHKEKEGAAAVIKLLDEGKNVALISDAGTPCISDPGAGLVKRLQAGGYEYTVVPGANAAISSVALCGIDAPFTFIGFLPEKVSERTKLVNSFKDARSYLIFYSAPHDVNSDLDFLFSILGDREVFIVKEITKVFEGVKKGTLKSTRAEVEKGEFVIITAPNAQEEKEYSDEELIALLKELTDKNVTKKEAVERVASLTNAPKNRVYKLSL